MKKRTVAMLLVLVCALGVGGEFCVRGVVVRGEKGR